MLFIFSLLLLFQSCLAATIDDFANFKPDPINGTTYCESVRGKGNQAGIACGAAAFNKMKTRDPTLFVQPQFGSTLVLLNFGWTARQYDFFQTCKTYFIQLVDGFYHDYTKTRCVTAFPTPVGVNASCNESSNVILRSGFGYCMKEPVCGASVPVAFIDIGPSGSNWVWGDGIDPPHGFGKRVATCYAYDLRNQSDPLEANILSDTY